MAEFYGQTIPIGTPDIMNSHSHNLNGMSSRTIIPSKVICDFQLVLFLENKKATVRYLNVRTIFHAILHHIFKKQEHVEVLMTFDDDSESWFSIGINNSFLVLHSKRAVTSNLSICTSLGNQITTEHIVQTGWNDTNELYSTHIQSGNDLSVRIRVVCSIYIQCADEYKCLSIRRHLIEEACNSLFPLEYGAYRLVDDNALYEKAYTAFINNTSIHDTSRSFVLKAHKYRDQPELLVTKLSQNGNRNAIMLGCIDANEDVEMGYVLIAFQVE